MHEISIQALPLILISTKFIVFIYKLPRLTGRLELTY